MSEITLNIIPTEKQSQCWNLLLSDDDPRFILFGGGAGGGKTYMYCQWLVEMAYAFPGSRGFIGRVELKRIMNSTYVTFTKVCMDFGVPNNDWKLDAKWNVIRFVNGSTIDLLDVAQQPGDPDYTRFGSTEYSHGFGEEVGEWPFAAFDVLKSRIGRHKITHPETGEDITPTPKFGLSCNPTKDWPYRIFYRPWKTNTLPKEYAFIQSLYLDNPYTAKEYGKQLELITNPIMRERLMNGNWDYEEDQGILFQQTHLVDILNNPEGIDKTPYMTVDVARYGSDKCVINIWRGWTSYKRIRFGKSSITNTADRIKEIAVSEHIPYRNIIIDADGVGGGVLDLLPGTRSFIAASTPIQTKKAIKRQFLPNARTGTVDRAPFQHLKAQCVFKLAEIVEEHIISVVGDERDDELLQEFAAHKQRDPDIEGKLKVTTKDEVRDAIGRSPDEFDTFMMRAWFALLDDANGKHTREVKESEWNPQMNHDLRRNNFLKRIFTNAR